MSQSAPRHRNTSVAWPEGKRFAFSIFDDTDEATVDNVGAVYGFLSDCGFRTTKSCWVFRGDPQRGKHQGETLEDDRYRLWLLDLQAKGFEIGWHGATWHGSSRQRIAEAMERFAEVFGRYPKTAANHTVVEDGMYWGSARLSGWRRLVYNLLTEYRNVTVYSGHVKSSPCFWGDICQQRIKYYRNFVFEDVNTLASCPFMPYHDAARDYVNYWFASSNGGNIDAFTRCLAEKNQDRLEAEGGACILYTHFACGFGGGHPEPRFKMLMKRLAKKNGWFVPVGTLLDHLLAVYGHREITDAQRRRLERKWLFQKIVVGKT